ncbi:Type-1 restriction enzyme EcoKI specificity protein [Rosistilla ulvae]|uniref:Type-1 restriction enzyme EcoKI specificity protein n=1 Tax=Rosistilla ulvae TaxID=1930277 RepID=A0A517M7T1_9BACT|nr:restriction endonuclease subunit S [Rosistilla ulvae]QDS90933.1 Type-1 restriction enzyme EcoKI specificity protein [Rosistilla ulvae]
MSFPAYDDYKDSGVAWLGEIPERWDIRRLKFVSDIQTGDKDTVDAEESGIFPFFVRSQTVERISTKTFDCEAILTAGDGVGVGKVFHYHHGPFDFHQRVYMMNNFRDVDGRFLFHYLKSNFYKVALEGGAKSTVDSIRRPMLTDFPVSFPPCKREQKAISAFLDVETAKIDGLVSEQRRLIELLKEKRQAVISHAVTKGLNPNVPMKPSGIPWLGDVPEHWSVKRLKHVSPFISVGIVVNPTNYVSEDPNDLPFIYGGDIREGVIDWANSRRIHRDSSATQEKTQLETNDLLVVRVGAPGVTAVVPEECEGGNCASVMLMRKGDFNSHWLCYVMNTRVIRFQVEIVEYGAAQKQFNIAHAVNFWVPVPDRAEQDNLVAELDKQIGEFDQLQSEAERAIELLQERRTALISAAVTGKIDVREFATRELACEH